MYWTHLIFALFGVLVFKGLSAAKPGYLDFDNLPETNFSCENKVIGGYYADVETGCQMFHVCTIGQKGEITDIKFLCLNGTVFDQETRVCERIDEVDCSKSEDFFGLNLELYGNNGHQGNQAESEFECEECSTEDDYDEDEETTTVFSTTTTTTTPATITTPTTTTVKSTTDTKLINYPSSSPESIVALLALHNAFTISLQQQQQKVNPPPPRLINNAFASTIKTTQKPSFYETTQSESINLNLKSHYSTTSQGDYSSVSPIQQQRPKPFFQVTTPPPKANYHHFQSSDTSFGHSFDLEKPYNFQFFHSRRIEEPTQKSSVSVVTSTSTSTSIRTSKSNTTDYPTGYDYQEGDVDPFFRDVPKIRVKRDEKQHPNHRYPEDKRQLNHNYDEKNNNTATETKEAFLSNLLDSLDMDEHERKKMVDFFVKENKEIKENNTKIWLRKIGVKIGGIIMDDINKTMYSQEEGSAVSNKSLDNLWSDHFDEMKQEVQVDFKISEREKRELYQRRRMKRQVRRGNIDTEQFGADNGRRRKMRVTNRTTESTKKTLLEVKPVSEEIDEGDFTTTPYRRVVVNKRPKNLVRTTEDYARTSKIRFNYETTTAISSRSGHNNNNQPTENRRRLIKPININITRDTAKLKEVPVYEELENPASSDLVENREVIAQTKVPNNKQLRTSERTPPASRGREVGRRRTSSARATNKLKTSTTTTTQAPTIDPTLIEDTNFSCEGKVKGGFYADIASDCRGFFICSQGLINGPLLKSHFWCGATTKFNQRSRTCQADYIVECSVSSRYYHLNNDFLVPALEEELKESFEPMKVTS